MIKRHSVLTGLTISLILLAIAIAVYPGGTYENQNSIGFDWTRNYISNLFKTTAVNGSHNDSRIWAYFGMFFYTISCAIFFVNMSKKLPDKNGANILKYVGILTMPFTFLVITPLHDLMLTISSFLFWTCIIVITVFIMKTRLLFFKFYNIVCLLIFYYAVYLHATNNWDLLPIMQKVNIGSSILLILGHEYFTKTIDFAHIKPRKQKV
jgi:hypothetical protein